jgi:hypothetical protein
MRKFSRSFRVWARKGERHETKASLAPRTIPSALNLRVEKLLAIAQRAVWTAANLAESARDQSTADDLHQIADEIRRIQESLLRRPTGHWAAQRHRA